MGSVEALLDRVIEVCPLPKTAQQVLALTRSETATAAQVAAVVSTDPALASSVLRIANSASQGMRSVERIEDAVVRIGLRELHDTAAAMVLLATFRSRAELSLQLHDACVVSAAVGHTMAWFLKFPRPTAAFTSGLLCEIGAMACLAVDGASYVGLWESVAGDGATRVERERARYGASSFVVGRRFLERNQLPAAVCEAVGHDLHDEMESPTELARITALARHVVPIVKRSGELRGDVVESQLGELATHAGVGRLDGAQLSALCRQAGAVAHTALSSLR